MQLAEQDDKLTLRPLYDKYIINCRWVAHVYRTMCRWTTHAPGFGISSPCTSPVKPCADGRKRPCCALGAQHPLSASGSTLLIPYVAFLPCARGEAKHLADGHKMALLRKVLRTTPTPCPLTHVWSCYCYFHRGEAKHLADGHKMALLRKVLRTFNTGAGVRVNRAERLARKVDQHVVLRDQVRGLGVG